MTLKFFESSPNDQKQPKQLVLFLHGYGSNGRNLIDLAEYFKPILPEAHFISPHAPMPLGMASYDEAYQWFSLYHNDLQRTLREAVEANQILDNFINEQLKRFALSEENLLLAGFSQGAMMSILNGLTRKNKIAGVLAYSGRVIPPDTLGLKINAKPPICLVHGTADQVVPFSHMIEGANFLQKNNIEFEAHKIEAMPHIIDAKAIEKGQDFLGKIF